MRSILKDTVAVRATSQALALGPLALLAILGTGAAGCGIGVVDITVARGDLSYHMGLSDCAVHYTGITGYPPTSIDLNCPVDLQVSSEQPALLLSVPLTTPVGSVMLVDPKYGDAGYIPGHFLTVTYRTGGDTIYCDPKLATGTVDYVAIPQISSTMKQRLAASFSAGAALLNCYSGAGPSPGDPLTLSGHFDLQAP